MSDYLDGELAPAGRTRMERHLGECARCRRLLADLRRTVDELRRLPAPRAVVNPVQLAASVRARLSDPD
jgi:anti-sigma factor RsiW